MRIDTNGLRDVRNAFYDQLNDRIDGYLQKKELLPAEILDLAQAKFHIMSCMEIIRDHMRYPPTDTWYEEEPE